MTTDTKLDARQYRARHHRSAERLSRREGGAYARGGDSIRMLRARCRRALRRVARALKQRGGLVAASQFTLWPDAARRADDFAASEGAASIFARGDFAPGSRGQANVDALARSRSTCRSGKVAYSAFFNTQLDWVLRRARHRHRGGVRHRHQRRRGEHRARRAHARLPHAGAGRRLRGIDASRARHGARRSAHDLRIDDLRRLRRSPCNVSAPRCARVVARNRPFCLFELQE